MIFNLTSMIKNELTIIYTPIHHQNSQNARKTIKSWAAGTLMYYWQGCEKGIPLWETSKQYLLKLNVHIPQDQQFYSLAYTFKVVYMCSPSICIELTIGAFWKWVKNWKQLSLSSAIEINKHIYIMEHYASVRIKQIIARHNNRDESKNIMLGDGNNAQKNSYCINPST